MPRVLAGPILRKTTTGEVNWWLATSSAVLIESVVSLTPDLAEPLDMLLTQQTVNVSDKLCIHLVTGRFNPELPKDQLIYYDMTMDFADGTKVDSLREAMPDLFYPGETALHFFIPKEVSTLLFGSCRNPHYPCSDTFVDADHYLQKHKEDMEQRPAALIHGGDQVYVDDVGGPMLLAIHQLIERLAIPGETLPDDNTRHSKDLTDYQNCLYNRQSILPKCCFDSQPLLRKLLPFRKEQPVFSSVKAENHLVSAAEMIGLYMLVWSPACWSLVDESVYEPPIALSGPLQAKFARESAAIREFVGGLAEVRRLFAHVPNYMIFDDHDVTDDWNLTAQWEQNVYSNPFSKRVISNALLGYWLFQGWGNNPQSFDSGFVNLVETVVSQENPDKANELEKILLDFPQWHYSVDLDPAIIVLDTRTHRWRSEKSLKNPSGLMDWERLLELEQLLVDKEAGIIVSAAPIFGVKFIETIQRIFYLLRPGADGRCGKLDGP